MNNENRIASDIGYSDIKVGAVYSFEKEFSQKDVMDFAKLTGDFSPLHVDEEFGKKSRFKRNVIHGMLAASLFSTLVGMYCPGKKCIYLSQTLKFRKPIFPGDRLLVKGTVISKSESIRVVTIKTEILVKDIVVTDGEAKAMVTEDE